MARRARHPVLIGLAAIAVLAAAALGLSAGVASSRPFASPASTQRPDETIQQCLKTLAGIQAQAKGFRKLRADVLAKRTYLYTVGRFQGNALFVPVGVDEFTYFLTEEILLGKMKASQVAGAVRAMKRMTDENLGHLNEYIRSVDGAIQKQQAHCKELKQGGGTPAPKPPPTAAGTLTLDPSLTKVENPNSNELTIDAAGQKATDDTTHLGGAQWVVEYSWKVPQTLTAGKTAQITIGAEVKSVNPSQPLLVQISALAPDFADAVQAHWPDNPQKSTTFDVPIAADLKDANEVTVTIGMLSAHVIYHYRK